MFRFDLREKAAESNMLCPPYDTIFIPYWTSNHWVGNDSTDRTHPQADIGLQVVAVYDQALFGVLQRADVENSMTN